MPSVTNTTVCHGMSSPVAPPALTATSEAAAISDPRITIPSRILVRSGSGPPGARGGRRATSAAAGSFPSATPGTPCVSRLIQRIWRRLEGDGEPDERPDEHHKDLGQTAGQPVDEETDEVVVRPPALADRGGHRRQVVLDEHQVGGLLRDLGAPTAEGDTDVGSAQGGRVVDAVPGHRDDVSAAL